MLAKNFKVAPMDGMAKTTTILLVLFASVFPYIPQIPKYTIIILPIIILTTWLFSVKGFTLEGQMLLIHHPFWSTEIELPLDLIVEVEPEIKKGLFKTMGNGGIFGYTGRFKNKKLGNFKTYATNWNNAISIRGKFSNFCIVVTPENIEYFLASFTK